MAKPLCFVLMPFGQKKNAAGVSVDFDFIYKEMIAPAVDDAGLTPLRADAEEAGGLIHKPMYERLILCKYAVADLSTGNANVFYELGLRHAVRPWSTVMLYSNDGTQMPFDVRPLRTIPYKVTGAGHPEDAGATRVQLAEVLRAVRRSERARPDHDSPVFQVVKGYPPLDISGIRSNLFAEHQRALDQKQRIAAARGEGREALRELRAGLGALEDLEPGVTLELLTAYRETSHGPEDWQEMLDLIDAMPELLRETIKVREQYGLAPNRLGRGAAAEAVLEALIDERGASSETLGILGRVYKDCWRALKEENTYLAGGLLSKAIDTYLRGFEADWRDAYPGINAATLMEVKEPPDPRRTALLPLVVYAAERRVTAGSPDYWDYATLLEAHVLKEEEARARLALGEALARMRGSFGPGTTAYNLSLIREAREGRGSQPPWATEIERALAAAAKAAASKAGAKKPGAKKSPGKKSPAKKTSAKKSSAKKSAAKKSSAKKVSAKRASKGSRPRRTHGAL